MGLAAPLDASSSITGIPDYVCYVDVYFDSSVILVKNIINNNMNVVQSVSASVGPFCQENTTRGFEIVKQKQSANPHISQANSAFRSFLPGSCPVHSSCTPVHPPSGTSR